MAYYASAEGSSRRPRVRFYQDDRETYAPDLPRRYLYSAPTASRRRGQYSGNEYVPERVPASNLPPWTHLERRMPSHHGELSQQTVFGPPAPSGRRLRHRDAETAEVPPPPGMARYSQSPPRMDSREGDDVYSWPRNTRRDTDQASNRSHSPSRVQHYDANDGPTVHAYKSGDAQVYIVDEGQADRGFRPPSPMGGDLAAYGEFNFLFPKSASKDDELSDLESPAVDSDSAHREDRDISIVSNAKRIYSSHYLGSAEPGGVHAAKLTELFDTKGKKRSLFKWL
ncbi:hypothetical protein J3458_003395 [Metarhizium acridum]|uniref:uncharacterized protein n=1 Tax=Metarhizium acridum TaxID=92637 RepID=UPI001C6B564D|nr:hypothetical protein J3458_003395 [Metarhizium acridum]